MSLQDNSSIKCKAKSLSLSKWFVYVYKFPDTQVNGFSTLSRLVVLKWGAAVYCLWIFDYLIYMYIITDISAQKNTGLWVYCVFIYVNSILPTACVCVYLPISLHTFFLISYGSSSWESYRNELLRQFKEMITFKPSQACNITALVCKLVNY